MFDFGFWEVVLITIVALLVVGPERLPGLAKQAGLWIGKARRFVSSVRSDIERELEADELKKILNQQQSEIQELKGMIAETHSEVKAELEQADDMVKSIEAELESESKGEKVQPTQDRPGATAQIAENDAKRSTGS